MRIDEQTLLRLVTSIEGWQKQLDTRMQEYNDRVAQDAKIRTLESENTTLRLQISGAAHGADKTRQAKLNALEKHLEEDKKLEYNKGYAAAYTEITNKMKA